MKSSLTIPSQPSHHMPDHPLTFSIISLPGQDGKKLDVQVDFSPPSADHQGIAQQGQSIRTHQFHTMPVLNEDSDPLAPTFILPPQKARREPKKRLSICSILGERQEDEANEILIAKPNSSFCSVCRVNFSDYLNHIKRQKHIKKVREQNKKLKMEELMRSYTAGRQKKIASSHELKVKRKASKNGRVESSNKSPQSETTIMCSDGRSPQISSFLYY